ncbi:hypothetical protein SAMD00019534_114150 [Acytostelium subglobosum LB1]|uniref:hypothetical protein n=1 Tax=Acytostelium subglobosum LB1 TaxID=1410327 RepID=UPI0006449EA6|nr:hypothetical protein SAMD00019534_114150 [Acytostelium subglobosum LB1]GAM28239.1 hypothetical protein SAMD00019534_114150 [Acytostelium subglobosum LB1]|eukprot:XP_012748873.1 hypothetical protein SAMD00019534_114150 [Acytostelium subglobosum LB1]
MQSLNRSILRSALFQKNNPVATVVAAAHFNHRPSLKTKANISSIFRGASSSASHQQQQFILITGLTNISNSNINTNSNSKFGVRYYSTPSNTGNSNTTGNTTTTSDLSLGNPINTEGINSVAEVNVSHQLVDAITTSLPPPPPNPIIEAVTNFNDSIVEAVNQFAVSTGTPWWLCIVTGTIILRTLLLPFTVKTQRNQVKMMAVREEMEKNSYLNDGTMEGRMKLMALQQELSAKNGVSPLSMMGLAIAQAPFYIYFFVLIRNACMEFPQYLSQGGMLWFRDLSAMDPTYMLPVLSSFFQFISVRMTFTEGTNIVMKTLMGGLCLIPLFFTLTFPAGLNIYWCVNSLIFILQNWLFRKVSVKKFFNIPLSKADVGIKTSTIQYAPVKNVAPTITEELAKKDNAVLVDKLTKLRQEVKTAKTRAMDESFGTRRRK